MQSYIKDYADILIIGTGGAGLTAAVLASDAGYRTICLSKVHPLKSHTIAAQGGINASLGNMHSDDWRWHMHDTLIGGDGLADEDAVALLCQKAPDMIQWLESMGMCFSRTDSGHIYQRPYGGQTTHYGKGKAAHRACAAEDRTGYAMLTALYYRAEEGNILFHNDMLVLDLLMQDGRCRGVLAWDIAKANYRIYEAKQIILATGGGCQMYQTSTVAHICTGDGNAMALRAGLFLQDMEFIQFHPTGLHQHGVLVTEAARAEGGLLYNGLGERFLERYAPFRKELSSRDIIARAIAQEIAEGRGCGPEKDHVLLSLAHLDSDLICQRLPMLKGIVQQFGQVDVTKNPVPVSPSAHYMMGGIATELDGAVKGVKGLHAIGETACVSVHGANRLGCNSLLELVVFAHEAVQSIRHTITTVGSLPEINPKDMLDTWQRRTLQKGNASIESIHRELRRTMQQYVGVFRHGNGLLKAKRALSAYDEAMSHVALADIMVPYSSEWQRWVETYNLLEQAHAIVDAALYRTESRGAHYRDDFPKKNNEDFLYHTMIRKKAEGIFDISKSNIRCFDSI